MAKQSDPPDLSPSPKDREVLEEIARLIRERHTPPATGGAAKTEPRTGSDGLFTERQVRKQVVEDVTPNSVDFGFVAGLLDAIPAGVALCSGDTIVHANAAFASAFGYRAGADLMAAGGLDTLFPEDAPGNEPLPPPPGRARQTWTAATRNGRRIQMPLARQSFGSGADSYWLIMLQPSPVDDLPGREAAPVLEALAAVREEGALQLNSDGMILATNEQAERLLGRPGSELLGTRFDALFGETDADTLRQARTRLLQDAAAARAERQELSYGFPGGDQRRLDVVLAATPGDPSCAFLVLLEALVEPEESAGGDTPAPQLVLGVTASNLEFLAKISHEIRTPLNSIIGFAEFMKEERLGPIGNVKYRGYIDDIHRSGQHALSLINDLLDLSKIESGNFEPNFTAVDANEVLADCVKLLQPQAHRDRVVVRTSLRADLPPVLADRRSLTQIALNLLSNAVKFTESGGQVIAATAVESNGAIKISVRDTGVGMTEAEIEQAMTPFRQLDTAPRKRDGTGLGLPLTKALVEANRATMHVKSRPRSGTRVDVIFPASRTASRQKPD